MENLNVIVNIAERCINNSWIGYMNGSLNGEDNWKVGAKRLPQQQLKSLTYKWYVAYENNKRLKSTPVGARAPNHNLVVNINRRNMIVLVVGVTVIKSFAHHVFSTSEDLLMEEFIEDTFFFDRSLPTIEEVPAVKHEFIAMLILLREYHESNRI